MVTATLVAANSALLTVLLVMAQVLTNASLVTMVTSSLETNVLILIATPAVNLALALGPINVLLVLWVNIWMLTKAVKLVKVLVKPVQLLLNALLALMDSTWISLVVNVFLTILVIAHVCPALNSEILLSVPLAEMANSLIRKVDAKDAMIHVLNAQVLMINA